MDLHFLKAGMDAYKKESRQIKSNRK